MLPEPPVIGFITRETGTVDAGLLACTETDDLPVLCIADGVGLGVFEGDCCHGEIDNGGFGEDAIGGGDDVGEGLGGDFDVVAVLGEGDSIDLAGLGGWGLKWGINQY